MSAHGSHQGCAACKLRRPTLAVSQLSHFKLDSNRAFARKSGCETDSSEISTSLGERSDQVLSILKGFRNWDAIRVLSQ